MGKQMDEVCIHIVMEASMWGHGKMTTNMQQGQIHGLIAASISEIINSVTNMGKAVFNGRMDLCARGSFLRMICIRHI